MRVIRDDPHWDAEEPLTPEYQADDGGITRVWYSGANGARVPALLVGPDAPKAGIVYQHAATGEPDWALAQAQALAAEGFASLSIAAPFARPDPHCVVADWSDPASVRAAYLQSIIDVRRGVEFLVREVGVRPRRIGYVGKNLGGAIAGGVVAREDRIAAVVTIASLPRMSEFWAKADHPQAIARRKQYGQAALDRAAELTAEFDLCAAPHAACDWLLQFGSADDWTPPSVVLRETAALRRAIVRWYPDGHDLVHAHAESDRRDFLLERLS